CRWEETPKALPLSEVRSCRSRWAFSVDTTSEETLPSHPFRAIKPCNPRSGHEVSVNRTLHRRSHHRAMLRTTEFSFISGIRHEPHFHQHTRYVGRLEYDEAGMTLRVRQHRQVVVEIAHHAPRQFARAHACLLA